MPNLSTPVPQTPLSRVLAPGATHRTADGVPLNATVSKAECFSRVSIAGAGR